MSAAFVFARVHLQGREGGAMVGAVADERSNRRSQLLRNCLSCVLTARIFLPFNNQKLITC